MGKGLDTAEVIKALTRLRRKHFLNKEHENDKSKPEFVEHSLKALVLKYLEVTGRDEDIEVLTRSSGNPHGKQTRAQLLDAWRQGDEINRYLAAVLMQDNALSVQKDIFQRVLELMDEGKTLGQAAYQLEKRGFWGDRQTIKKAFRREAQKYD